MLLSEQVEEGEALFFMSKSRAELCKQLELSWKQIRFLAFQLKDRDKYRHIEVKKKNGENRNIRAPNKLLKSVQHKILQEILEPNYRAPSCSHGFIAGKDIAQNASMHKRSRILINIDLADFFPTISFPRVMGMYMGKPFSFSRDIAIILARLCCFDGRLPQGAPTSPIISNIICIRLDRKLTALAKQHRFRYTRYADDITFSSRLTGVPASLGDYKSGKYSIPKDCLLHEIITDEGFSINPDKIKCANRHGRQMVTGLVVNKKVNIPRRFIREVRRELCWIEKHGIDDVRKKYEDLHPEGPDFVCSLHGKIEYVKSIRGAMDVIYLALAKRYITLSLEPKIKLPPSADLALHASRVTYVIESSKAMNQGSAFLYRGFIVSASHCIEEDYKDTYALTQVHSGNENLTLSFIDRDEYADISILKLKYDPCEPLPPIKGNPNPKYDVGETVYVSGFPQYAPGNSVSFIEMKISGSYNRISRYYKQVDKPIIVGTSGGPVFDSEGSLVGIATHGSESPDKVHHYKSGFAPLEFIDELINKQKQYAESEH